MARKYSNAHLGIASLLMVEGAKQRAREDTQVHQNRHAFTAKKFEELISSDDKRIAGAYLGAAMLSVTAGLEKGTAKQDANLRDAFQIAGLDIKNPLHWKVMLSTFCDFNFSDHRTVASADEGYPKVIEDVDRALKKHPSLRNNAKKKKTSVLAGNITTIATHLQRHHKDYKYNIGHIRKLVRHAHDKRMNLAVRYPEMSDRFLRGIRDAYERNGIEWTPTLEKEQSDLLLNTKRALDRVLEQLGLPPEFEKL